MKWQKRGLIYVPDGNLEWNKSHAQLPIVDTGYSDIWRIYYATRNDLNQSTISYIDIEKGNPEKVVYVHDKPLLPFGKLGTFDESGLMPVAIVNYNNIKYLYYAGWSLKKTIPYHNTIGLAVSKDGNTFQKYGEGPLFDLTPFEPYSNGTINILIQDEKWKAWYQSVTEWAIIDNRPEPFYHLKYAESLNGIIWNRKPDIAIDFKDQDEAGICSASVLFEDNFYKMWYSFRKKKDYRNDKSVSYRIGYAESIDGRIWVRKDDTVGIDISNEGWDNEMIAYPNVVVFEGKKLMFFNGNGFGRTGFGYAIQD